MGSGGSDAAVQEGVAGVNANAAAPRRYLRYDETTPVVAGMDHQLMNLECLLCEARAAGRLAVLPALRLAPNHNFGVQGEWKWDSYFDLDGSRLVDAAGTQYPLPIARHPPGIDVPASTLAPGQRAPEAARNCVLAVRRIEHYNYYRVVPEECRAPLRLLVRHSRRVRELARLVVADLRARRGGRFVGVHARRGDRVGQYPSRLTEPAAIRCHLRDHGVPHGSVVFLMSDEHDPAFWEPLGEHYDLVRYTHYPPLAELVSRAGDRPPDNYLLYAVEKEITSNAWMRVDTRPDVHNSAAHSALVDELTWDRFLWRRDDRFRQSLRKLNDLAGGVARRLRRRLRCG